jgi:Cu/Ag efflux protein CusF
MSKLKAGLIISSALVIGLLSGCGTEGKTNGGTAQAKTNENLNEEILVDKNLYLEGNGTYVGQIDNRSIEITINGKPIAFKLTDEAFKQLESIKEGDEVSFVYTDSKIEQKTIEKFQLKDSKISMTKSVLEVDQTLVDLQAKLHDTKEQTVLKGMTPFEVFSLYMYVKAGQDFETLYYFHELDTNSMTVEQFKKENMNSDAIAQNDAFFRKLDQVREFEVVQTDENRVYIAFTLPNDDHTYEFKMVKSATTDIWQVMWMPFQ